MYAVILLVVIVVVPFILFWERRHEYFNAGWVWAHELDHYFGENPSADDTRYQCDGEDCPKGRYSLDREAKPAITIPMNTTRDNAVQVVRTLQEAGFEAVFAGGCVRDTLLGVEPHDFDIATSATPDDVEGLFENTVPVGRAFGVVIVVVEGDEFEVATFRTDGEYTNNRRPDAVEFSSIEFDATRRDFTINALFENPVTGEILDFVGGVEDLRNGVVRTCGDPASRFAEDALRLLRLARFAARFDAEVDPATLEAARSLAHTVEAVSAERVGAELANVLTGPNPDRGLEVLRETGVLPFVLPEVC